MNPVPRKLDSDTQDLIDEYIKNGGKISIQIPLARSEEIEYIYNKKKAKKE